MEDRKYSSTKRKETFVNYVLEKLKSRLNDGCAKPHDYKRCEYTYQDDANNTEDNLQNDQESGAVDTSYNEARTLNYKKKKIPAKDSERIYQASLPIEGLEVTREISDSCEESDSADNEPKKRRRKRKRRHRVNKVMIEESMCMAEEVPETTPLPIPQPSLENPQEKKLSKRKRRKEATIASVRAGLKTDALSLAKIWNNFFEARFSLVTETENVGDNLPESCNRIITNTECQGVSSANDTLIDNRLLSEDNSTTSDASHSREPAKVPFKKEERAAVAAAFEDRYQDLEKSDSSHDEENGSTKDKVRTFDEPESKDSTVKLTKNQRRKRRKKKRQFYLRKEQAERKINESDKIKEENADKFEKTKDEVITFFDSMWEIYQQEMKEKLNHDDLERMRLNLLQVFDDLQNLQKTTPTFENLVSIKKWLLLLDSNRARAVLQTYQLSDTLQDHKLVIKSLVEYWITDVAPSLGRNSAS